MNQKALELLEYNKIKERLKEFVISEVGKKLVEDMEPSNDIKRIENQLIETTEAKAIVNKSSSVPIQNLVGIDRILEKLDKSEVLNTEELRSILGLLRSTRKIKKFMEEQKYIAPLISTYASSMYEQNDIIEEIDKCIVNNRIDDNATPMLSKIRKKIYITENRLRTRLDEILKSPKYRPYLQDNIISTRNGKYVISVKSEYRRNVEGAVIDTSSTGSTVFIEPASIGKLQGDYDLLKIEEEKEEYQILLYLSLFIESYKREIKINIETMAYYEFLIAKGKYSQTIDGNSAKVNTNRYTKIKNARHPMLGIQAVPLNFEIGKGYHSLVITGPNTGGKTVALKTIGILTLMIQSGLHVPVDKGSEFAIFSEILVDIGDGQSIEQSLSTFSSHIKNIINILKVANKYTLVILDELGSGTDPTEGEGLAIAILDELYKKETVTVATSHYGEIKNFANNHHGFENGRMEFDIDTLKPTYKLTIGEAGESNAFLIALRLGMNKNIIEKAHEVTYKEKMDYTSIAKEYKITSTNSGYEKAKKQKLYNEHEAKIKQNKDQNYNIGDVVFVHTIKQRGTIYKIENDKGEIGVMVKNEKIIVNKKRISPFISANDLYPDMENYDMDIVFETKENRKKKKLMKRKYVEGLERTIID